MKRPVCAAALLVAMAGIAPLRAEEPANAADEIAALRETVEAQGVRIDALTRAVERLTGMLLSNGRYQEPAALPSEMRNRPAAQAPVATPEPAATAVAAAPAEPAEPPVAVSGITHEVQERETLTVIAKKYGVSVGELMKANQIKDAKKLQIGQVLRIPATPNSPSTPTP